MIDKTVEENEKKSGEEDLEETPKKKGRPGRKKGIHFKSTINIKYSKFLLFYYL
jgi:hypothetical protein